MDFAVRRELREADKVQVMACALQTFHAMNEEISYLEETPARCQPADKETTQTALRDAMTMSSVNIALLWHFFPQVRICLV